MTVSVDENFIRIAYFRFERKFALKCIDVFTERFGGETGSCSGVTGGSNKPYDKFTCTVDRKRKLNARIGHAGVAGLTGSN
jgi:hypothetical protein